MIKFLHHQILHYNISSPLIRSRYRLGIYSLHSGHPATPSTPRCTKTALDFWLSLNFRQLRLWGDLYQINNAMVYVTLCANLGLTP